MERLFTETDKPNQTLFVIQKIEKSIPTITTDKKAVTKQTLAIIMTT